MEGIKGTLAVLTGGGDCPGLNAVIRAVVKTALHNGYQIYGISNGFHGLIQGDMRLLSLHDVSGILPRGGTVLGTTNRDNPFRYASGEDEKGNVIYKDMRGAVVQNLKDRGVECLVIIGGDGSLKIGYDLNRFCGVNVVGVPKTIDNDLPCTERTFGFDTAVAAATDALDRLHTTAESHHRVMVLEVMGRYAGWIALHSGLAGGADVILIPEIPYNIDSVIAKIRERQQQGKKSSIITVAEGAKPIGGKVTVARIVKESFEQIRLGGIGNKLADQIEQLTGIESRCTVLGYLQRGGSPTAYDRVLSTRYGVEAAEACIQKDYNIMVALSANRIIRVPIEKVADHAHQVPLDSDLIKAGRELGICFGD